MSLRRPPKPPRTHQVAYRRAHREPLGAATFSGSALGVSHGRSSAAPHAKHQPPGNRLNRDSPPPHQFARHGAHTKPPRIYRNPGGIPRPPEPQTRRGIDIPRRDIRVSELCEDRSPVGARGNIYTPKLLQSFSRGTQRSRRFRRISGIFLDVRPLGLEPRTH